MRFSLILLLLFFSLKSVSQTVSGKVTTVDGNSIPYAFVYLKNSNK